MLVVAKNGSLYASALWYWKSGPIYCYAESKKASLGGAAVSRQIPSSSKNWSLSHSHEGAQCYSALPHCSTKISPASVSRGRSPRGHEFAVRRHARLWNTGRHHSYRHFPPNVIIWLFLVNFFIFDFSIFLRQITGSKNRFELVQNVLKYLVLVFLGNFSIVFNYIVFLIANIFSWWNMYVPTEKESI